MRKTFRLTERDLTRIVKRVIREDVERFTISDVRAGLCGNKGTWRLENTMLLLEDINIDGYIIDASIEADKM